ncbi:unnamed protein product [Trichogramma brassicae]|uniref:WD repeat-containing protein 78 n=1 Tax=Trichogramma brassicae TaxID=86971 RepID=A0A6H5IDQ7_9HYME|nr:unnamed protein product [Trichogramma brassicae]
MLKSKFSPAIKTVEFCTTVIRKRLILFLTKSSGCSVSKVNIIYRLEQRSDEGNYCSTRAGHVQGIRRTNYSRGTEVPINRHTGIRVLRLHPKSPNEFYVGTEEGAIVRCSIDQPDFYLDHFLAHDGACYTMQYSPFCEKIFLTCGADWFCRIWAEGVTEPLMEFSTRMTSVSAATWCPKISTIFATASLNEVGALVNFFVTINKNKNTSSKSVRRVTGLHLGHKTEIASSGFGDGSGTGESADHPARIYKDWQTDRYRRRSRHRIRTQTRGYTAAGTQSDGNSG